jgi:NADPH:quinone reductase-like Zn-dependent oxidoreductase
MKWSLVKVQSGMKNNMKNLDYLLRQNSERFDLKSNLPTMKAVVTTGNGDYEKIEYRDVPIPVPDCNEVLLKVLAAGVNNTDINTRLGWYSSSIKNDIESLLTSNTNTIIEEGGWRGKTPFPLIQGTDCCGEVVKLGKGVGKDLLGKRVLVRPCMRIDENNLWDHIWLGTDFDGAFAEYVKVPVSEVSEINSDWTNEELASIPCAYGTAENMLQRAQVNAEDRVLVTGASGGVGSALVQLAKRRGAEVITVVGQDKIDRMYSLSVDRLIARGTDLVVELGESSINVVLDVVAGEDFGQLLKLLVRGGRYAACGAIGGAIVSMDMRDFYLKDLTLLGCTAWDEHVFQNLIGYIESNEINPLVAKIFPLHEIVNAQKEFIAKTHVGKIVLVPEENLSKVDANLLCSK